jgi:hypothetical protein
MEPSTEKAPELEKTKASRINFKTVVLWFFFCVLATLIISLSVSRAMYTDGMPAVPSRGKDIYVAITAANTEREPLGLANVWPKTIIPSGTDTTVKDISNTPYNNSSDYFYDLYDGENVGKPGHNPYVRGFDYSKLAGADVPAKKGGGKLTAENNMWAIAANITEEDDDHIPLLITRNADVKLIEYYVNHGGPTSNLNMRVAIGTGKYKTPYGNKGFACVRKDGCVYGIKAERATVKNIFNSQELPPRDPSKPPIVYLMP